MEKLNLKINSKSKELNNIEEVSFGATSEFLDTELLKQEVT